MSPGLLGAVVPLLALVWLRASLGCDDIDTQACELMVVKDPGLCEDFTIARSVCPKYCNLCPLTCYHCPYAVRNYSDCTSQKECGIGEKCLLATLLSSVDGHMEYKMNCASFEHCEGSNYLEILGRRDLHIRSISMDCCNESICNTPLKMATITKATTTQAPTTTPPTTPQPTTTTQPTTTPQPTTPQPTTTTTVATTSSEHSTRPPCIRDIEIIIENSGSYTHGQIMDIQHFLGSIVNGIDISPHGSAVGVATFGAHAEANHALSTNKLEVFTAVNRLNLSTQPTSTFSLQNAISFLQQRNQSDLPGGRSEVDNTIIFILDDVNQVDASEILDVDLSNLSHDVIVVVIGQKNPVLEQLATDPQHVFQIPNHTSLIYIKTALLRKICS